LEVNNPLIRGVRAAIWKTLPEKPSLSAEPTIMADALGGERSATPPLQIEGSRREASGAHHGTEVHACFGVQNFKAD
jgi:hypothetical protein